VLRIAKLRFVLTGRRYHRHQVHWSFPDAMDSGIRLIVLCGLLVAGAVNAQQRNYGPFPYDYAYANYALSDLDSGGIERSAFRVGGGYRWAVSPTIDLVAKLAYADTEIDRPGPGRNFDDDGLIVSGELRAWMSEDLELSVELSLDDSYSADLETVLEFGGQYYLDGNFSVGGRLRVDDNDTTLLLGGRFYFGRSKRR
jgi:hypothetical protein